MLRIMLLLAFVIIVLGFIFIKGNSFKCEGRTEGVCTEVKTEITQNDGSPYNEQLRGTDNRMYRPYIKYVWHGREYMAKSFRAYSQSKIFPGDTVQIMVSASDKTIVKIL